jgi:hypothetical protein
MKFGLEQCCLELQRHVDVPQDDSGREHSFRSWFQFGAYRRALRFRRRLNVQENRGCGDAFLNSSAIP